MKIFIIGANGRVASSLVDQLVSQGHQVMAGLRDISKLPDQAGVTKVSFDLHGSVDAMVEQLKGSDVVYFLAGSRGKDLLQTDAFGAVKAMQATQKAGIKRFIMLSALLSTEPEKWEAAGIASLGDYYVAKYFADHYLMTSTDLDYTILQPGSLLEAPGKGKVALSSTKLGAISIEDVASVLAELPNATNTIGKQIPLVEGEQDIADAIKKV